MVTNEDQLLHPVLTVLIINGVTNGSKTTRLRVNCIDHTMFTIEFLPYSLT